MSIIRCDICEHDRDTDYVGADYHENRDIWVCDGCWEIDERRQEEEQQRQIAYWKPLYEGEKLAGLLPANHYKDGR